MNFFLFLKHPVKTAIIVGILCSNTLLNAQVKQKETLTNSQVIDLVKSGLEKSIILATIQNTDSQFDVSAKGLVILKTAKVDNEIIAAMVSKSSGGSTSNFIKDRPISPAVSLINHPYVETKGQPLPTEKVFAAAKVKRVALGYGGGSVGFEIEGLKSATRLTTNNQSYSFLINTNGAPLPELTLYQLEIKKGKRFGIGIEYAPLGKIKAGKNNIPYNVHAVSPGLYRLTTTQPLVVGEYFFGQKIKPDTPSVEVFTFGID